MDQTALTFEPAAHGATIAGAEGRLAYIFGGDATFTLKSLRSGKHYTYRVKVATNKPEGLTAETHFVSVLCGPEEYAYVGCCFERGSLVITKASKLPASAGAVKAFRWLQRHPDSADCEIWHDGSCARCGRQLTDPESIATGLGPVCRTKA